MTELGVITVLGMRGFMWFVDATVYDKQGECIKSTFVGIPLLDEGFIHNPEDVRLLNKYTNVSELVDIALGFSAEDKDRAIALVDGNDLKKPNPLTRMSMLPGGLSLFLQTMFPAERFNIINDAMRQYSSESNRIVERLAKASMKDLPLKSTEKPSSVH